MGRTPCCDKMGLKKGPWTPDEDQKLVAYIQRNGHGSWRALPKHAGLLRCGKSCRLRWTNYLRPDIKRGRFSFEEEQVIIHLHGILGNRWSAIAAHLPGRTDNEIKNYWNTHLRKRLLQMGIDPVTHKARSNLLIENLDLKPVVSSTLSHMSQWDRVRMEMEARLSSDYFAKLSAHGAAIFEASNPSASLTKAPSDTSMRSWKTQVSESLLRRDFGVLEKPPPGSMDLQTVLQDWEDSLHCQPLQPGLYDSQMRAEAHSDSHSGFSQTPRIDNRSGTTVTDLAIHFETLPSFHQTSTSPSPLPQTSQISDSFTSSGTKLFPELPKPNSLPSMIPEHFSPTSTLSSPFSTSPSDFLLPPPSSHCEIAFSTSPPLQLPSPTFWTSSSAPTTMGASDLQLPSELPELLMELHAEPAVPHLIVATVPTTMAGTPGWTSQQGLIESKDYWANMLHLVGPPVQQPPTLLSTPARLAR